MRQWALHCYSFLDNHTQGMILLTVCQSVSGQQMTQKRILPVKGYKGALSREDKLQRAVGKGDTLCRVSAVQGDNPVHTGW